MVIYCKTGKTLVFLQNNNEHYVYFCLPVLTDLSYDNKKYDAVVYSCDRVEYYECVLIIS